MILILPEIFWIVSEKSGTEKWMGLGLIFLSVVYLFIQV